MTPRTDASRFIDAIKQRMKARGLNEQQMTILLENLRNNPNELTILIMALTNELLDKSNITTSHMDDTSVFLLARSLALTRIGGLNPDDEDDD